MRYVCLCILSVLLALLVPPASGQASLRADLTCEQCSSYPNMVVELTDSGRRRVGSMPVGPTGSVEFHNLREGIYMLTVRTVDGSIIHQDVVNAGRYAGPVAVRLPERRPAARPESGSTISVARLQHKIPRQAKKEYNKADERLGEGDVQGSIEHLQKAIEIDPEYMEAHNNLGSRYMILGDTQKAYACFRRALELDPHSPLVWTNTAIALFTMGELEGAEAAARRAIDLDPSDLKAKYILGLSLYMQQKFTDETIGALSKVQDRFPNATLVLARIHANAGQHDLARKSLKEYLRSGHTENKQKAEEMLASLQ